MGPTAAGTVPDFDRIPFSNATAKLLLFRIINKIFYNYFEKTKGTHMSALVSFGEIYQSIPSIVWMLPSLSYLSSQTFRLRSHDLPPEGTLS